MCWITCLQWYEGLCWIDVLRVDGTGAVDVIRWYGDQIYLGWKPLIWSLPASSCSVLTFNTEVTALVGTTPWRKWMWCKGCIEIFMGIDDTGTTHGGRANLGTTGDGRQLCWRFFETPLHTVEHHYFIPNHKISREWCWMWGCGIVKEHWLFVRVLIDIEVWNLWWGGSLNFMVWKEEWAVKREDV